MPQTTKVQTQSDLIYTVEAPLAVSLAIKDDEDTNLLLLFEHQEAIDMDSSTDDIGEILELSALNWIGIAEGMSGNGSRGPYTQISKSVDFFSICLQAPDREFRHMFR